MPFLLGTCLRVACEVMDREMSMLEGHVWRKRIGVQPYCNNIEVVFEIEFSVVKLLVLLGGLG